VTITE
jgi:hypothetical protein